MKEIENYVSFVKNLTILFFRWQLASSEREFISSALNSTLLEAGGFPARPPLEVSQPYQAFIKNAFISVS